MRTRQCRSGDLPISRVIERGQGKLARGCTRRNGKWQGSRRILFCRPEPIRQGFSRVSEFDPVVLEEPEFSSLGLQGEQAMCRVVGKLCCAKEALADERTSKGAWSA